MLDPRAYSRSPDRAFNYDLPPTDHVRQDHTTLTLQSLTPQSRLRGSLIFAERAQVEDPAFWERNCKKVRVHIQCTHQGQWVFNYPRGYAALSQYHRVNPVGENLDSELDDAIDDVRKELEAGHDVLLHCEHSFHRAPLVGAAIGKRLFDVKPMVL